MPLITLVMRTNIQITTKTRDLSGHVCAEEERKRSGQEKSGQTRGGVPVLSPASYLYLSSCFLLLITVLITGWNLSLGSPDGTPVKNVPAYAGDVSLKPGSGRFPWRRAWQPAPAFLPGDPVDRGAWRATVHGCLRAGHV